MQMGLEQLALEEIPEVVAHHADLLIRALGDEAAAAQQTADALLPGGIALFLPEFYALRPVIQDHHLADADEIIDGVDLLPHLNGDLLVTDVDGDRDALKRHVQTQPHRLATPQVLVYRLDAGALVDAYRRQHIPGAEAWILNAQLRQIGGGKTAVVHAHGGGGQDHHILRLQTAGGVGVEAVVEQAKALLGLLVDMGHDALPIHGEHGMGGRVHHILQNIHISRSLSAVIPLFYTMCGRFTT